MVGVEDALAARCGARDLDRRLDRLGAAVRGHDRRHARGRAPDQLLGEHPAQERHAELRQVAGAGGEHRLDRRDRLGMVAADREHAVAAEEVQVALAVRIDQVGAVAADPHLVEAERAHDAPHLRVQIAVAERELLARAGAQDLLDRRNALLAVAHRLSLAWPLRAGHALGELGKPPLQEPALGLGGHEGERALVRRARLVRPSQAPQEVGAGGVQVVVVLEI